SGRLVLLCVVTGDIDVAGNGNAHRIEGVARCLELAPVERDALADLLRRRELVEQQVETSARADRDRLRTAGRQPQRRMRALVGRRLDNHRVETEKTALVGERLAGG